MLNNYTFAVGPPPGISLSIGESLAPTLFQRLNQSREWIVDDDGMAFSDDTLDRVQNFISCNKQLVGGMDVAAGLDGSIGVLFRSRGTELYADFLNSGRIRVYAQDADGRTEHCITESVAEVSQVLHKVSPAIERLVLVSHQETRGFGFLGNDTTRGFSVEISTGTTTPRVMV
jgi:hypothetical protein